MSATTLFLDFLALVGGCILGVWLAVFVIGKGQPFITYHKHKEAMLKRIEAWES